MTVQTEAVEQYGTALPPEQRSRLRRVGDAYLNGNTPVLVFLAFVCAFVAGSVLIVASDTPTRTSMGYFFSDPSDTFTHAGHAIAAAYSAIFRGSVFNTDSLYSNGGVPVFGPLSETLVNAAPLILGGLAVSVAFRAGLFNIGVQGQVITGAIAAGYVGFAIQLPAVVHVIVAVLAGVVGGAVWGGLAGLFKAKRGAHEVITTIMLNYVAYYLLDYLLSEPGFQQPGTNVKVSRTVPGTARLPHLLGNNLRVNAGILIAAAAAVLCWLLLTKSTLGFRLRAVGANQFAARTAGINVPATYLMIMLISGALSGLAGATQVLGINTSLNQSIDASIGFNSITVALLAFASPGGVVLAGLLFGALNAGSLQLLASTHTPSELPEVMEAVIVLFIAAPGLMRTLFRLRHAQGGTEQLAKGWNG